MRQKLTFPYQTKFVLQPVDHFKAIKNLQKITGENFREGERRIKKKDKISWGQDYLK